MLRTYGVFSPLRLRRKGRRGFSAPEKNGGRRPAVASLYLKEGPAARGCRLPASDVSPHPPAGGSRPPPSSSSARFPLPGPESDLKKNAAKKKPKGLSPRPSRQAVPALFRRGGRPRPCALLKKKFLPSVPPVPPPRPDRRSPCSSVGGTVRSPAPASALLFEIKEARRKKHADAEKRAPNRRDSLPEDQPRSPPSSSSARFLLPGPESDLKKNAAKKKPKGLSPHPPRQELFPSSLGGGQTSPLRSSQKKFPPPVPPVPDSSRQEVPALLRRGNSSKPGPGVRPSLLKKHGRRRETGPKAVRLSPGRSAPLSSVELIRTFPPARP